jgi:hypothetical protein
MTVDLTLLKMHVDGFNKAKKYINEEKNLIVGTDVEAAFDTLKDHWRTGDFEPTEMGELVAVIKKNLKLFGSNRDLQTALKDFASMCEIYYTKDEDIFESFQAVMQNKKPFDVSIIQQIYEKEIGKLPEYVAFDEIHKKTNGYSLYELFNFEPDAIRLRILKSLIEDEGEFKKSQLKSKGKWQDLKLFANILKDEQSKENYDAYYRFLICKQILKGVNRRNRNLVSKNYIDIVGELEHYKICENSKQAECLIVDFCTEIGLICKPITAEEYAEHERRLKSKRQQIESKLKELKAVHENIKSSLSEINKNIEPFLLLMESSIKDMEKKTMQKKNETDSKYNEETKIKELDGFLEKLKKLSAESETIQESYIRTNSLIDEVVRDAENKESEVTIDNVNEVLSYVSSKDTVIKKYYDDFITEYNGKYKKDGTLKFQFNSLTSEFDKKIEEIDKDRETVGSKLEKNLRKYDKPLTMLFIWLQISLLVFHFLFHWGWVGFYSNIVLFIVYVLGESYQFNKYNLAVKEMMIHNSNKTKEIRKRQILLHLIIFILVVAIFALCVFCYKNPWTFVCSVVAPLIGIYLNRETAKKLYNDYVEQFFGKAKEWLSEKTEITWVCRKKDNLIWSIIAACFFFIVAQCWFLYSDILLSNLNF